MADIEKSLEAYRKILKEAQEDHRRQIAEAEAQLQKLIAAIDRETQVHVSAVEKPQSAWVTGDDGEKFMMLNQAAVDQFSKLFDGFKDVIELLAKQEVKK